jgi:hypothetical protein
MNFQRLIDRTRYAQFQRDLAVWVTLVAFGVVARWLQPMWQVTPTAAIGLFAGYYFANVRWALTAPIAVIALSHPLLPPYASTAVMAVVLLAFVVPALLGRVLGREFSASRFCLAAFLPSLIFYATTNFAVWAFLDYYTHDAAGLASCYLHAVPFYRWMFYGDLFYVAVIFGGYAFAVRYQWLPCRAHAVVKA